MCVYVCVCVCVYIYIYVYIALQKASVFQEPLLQFDLDEWQREEDDSSVLFNSALAGCRIYGRMIKGTSAFIEH